MLPSKFFSLHIDFIGLFRLGKTNEERIQNFEKTIGEHFLDNDCTVVIPSYSHSYTKKEKYDMVNSESTVGYVTEEMRKRWWRARTADPLFSYIVMGKGISETNFFPRDYESFGDNSLISELYEKNAMLCSIAASWKKTFTELHFIERLLEVKYRQNKTFYGKTIDVAGDVYETNATFFCKNYDYNLRSGHAQLAEDLIKDEVMKTINIDDKLQIKGVLFKDLHDYVEQKIKNSYFYLCEEIPNDGK